MPELEKDQYHIQLVLGYYNYNPMDFFLNKNADLINELELSTSDEVDDIEYFEDELTSTVLNKRYEPGSIEGFTEIVVNKQKSVNELENELEIQSTSTE